jgi:hypothetical protein
MPLYVADLQFRYNASIHIFSDGNFKLLTLRQYPKGRKGKPQGKGIIGDAP